MMAQQPNGRRSNLKVVSGQEAKPEKLTPEQLKAQREALEAQMQQLQEEEAAIQAQAEQEREADRLSRQEEHDELIAQAETNERLSLQANSPFDKRHYSMEATELRRKAREVYPEGYADEAAKPKAKSATKAHGWVAWVQSLGLLAFVGLSYFGFQQLGSAIRANNLNLPPDMATQAIRPFGLDSLQRLCFELLARGIDLMMLIGVLAIVAPYVAAYLIPVAKSPKDALHEFYNDLDAWQRMLITVLLAGFCLLYLAISHSVKP